MWSSAGANNNNKNNSKRVSCSPSKSSSSTCSSPSPFPSSSPVPRKSMEEVWKDINLASLHDHTTTTATTTATTATADASFRGMVFQDFLASPPNKDPPTKGVSSAATVPPPPCACEEANIFASPATVLSLNSGPDFQYLESSDLVRSNPQTSSITPSFFSSMNSPFDAPAPSSVFPSFSKKRAPETNDDHNSGDRRHKRMMKNRESAARSRARRQAYTNELELEVAHLMEENAKLRKQQEKLLQAAPAQLPKKHTLSRTSTAPF